MKRLIPTFLAIIMMAIVLGSSDAKAKKPVETDQTLIKKAVLVNYDAWLKHKKPTAFSSAKFSPIKIASNWATTTYPYELDADGNEVVPDNQRTYILKKSKGKWWVKMASEMNRIDTEQCKKIGLPYKTALKLEVVIYWEN